STLCFCTGITKPSTYGMRNLLIRLRVPRTMQQEIIRQFHARQFGAPMLVVSGRSLLEWNAWVAENRWLFPIRETRNGPEWSALGPPQPSARSVPLGLLLGASQGVMESIPSREFRSYLMDRGGL